MKKAHFFVDDSIWTLRDLTRQKPESLFDNPFFGMLKTAHDRYGLKTQINLFYKTSYFYGMDDFSLADVTDAYKEEFTAASDWLKFAFHAREEFPDYPHVNASYEDIYRLFRMIEGEVFRFAGEKSFAYGVCPHWLPVSEPGTRALYDCGVRFMASTVGDVSEYTGDPACLPYGHAGRLLQGRRPEAKLYHRPGRDIAIERSVCSYNHVPTEIHEKIGATLETLYDEKTGMHFKEIALTVLNLTPYDEIEAELAPQLGNPYIGICDHEQYFYEEYFAYQPDYAQKIFKMAEILKANGYEFIFAEDIVK